MMVTLNDTKILRLQRYLSALRKIAGWTAEDLGDLIGVTRQTIVNLENSTVKMSKLQYIAIRAVLDAEAQESNNRTLQQAISVFIDSDISKEERDKLRDEVNSTASRVGKRKGSAAISQAILLSSVIATILAMTPGLLLTTGTSPFWAMEILKELKKRKKD